MNTLIADISKIVGDRNVFAEEPMSAHTTFRVGGPAECLVAPQSVEQVRDVVQLVRRSGHALHIMGKGSNLLVSDAGLAGVVVQLSGNFSAFEIVDGTRIVAQAGVSNAKVAAAACRAGLTGFEFAAGIPGTIGGAAIMNAGAYDGELKQVACGVTCLDSEGQLIELTPEEAAWGYRRSAIADRGLIVLQVALQLAAGDPSEIQARMDELAARRQSKQPLDKPSAGSTFKRPEGHFAGKLIQDAGMQGYQVGGAQVSTKHAGFVVNVGDATAADVLQVIKDVRAEVLAQFGVALEPEVRLWGFTPEELNA